MDLKDFFKDIKTLFKVFLHRIFNFVSLFCLFPLDLKSSSHAEKSKKEGHQSFILLFRVFFIKFDSLVKNIGQFQIKILVDLCLKKQAIFHPYLLEICVKPMHQE